MKVTTRLNVAVMPAVVGLAVLAALAYWGDRGRQAPELVVALAVVATLASAVLSWRSTRVVARGIGAVTAEFRALGLNVPRHTARDEFEELALFRDAVRQLAHDQTRLREQAAHAVRHADSERQRHNTVLEQLGATVLAQLEEARLALHILQTSPFGVLNENQEELVNAARDATDAVDRELRHFTRLVTMPAKRRAATRESVALRALLEPALAMASRAADEAGVSIELALAEHLPPALVDRLAAQEALSLLLRALCADARPGTDLVLRASEADGAIELHCTPGLSDAASVSLPVLVAEALLDAQSGAVVRTPSAVIARLPVPPSAVWRSRAASGP